MLTPFGQLFERLCAERGLSKRAVAERLGISHSRLTESLRDPDHARANDERWYAPDLTKIDAMGRIFQLSGDELDDFTTKAHLAHSPLLIQELVAQLQARADRQDEELRQLRIAVDRLGQSPPTA